MMPSSESYLIIWEFFSLTQCKKKKDCSISSQLCLLGWTKLIGSTAFTPLNINVKVT